ncbi:MAG: Crp/Fnr family transcriptional regulator [Candidatus Heteroscillospira sp.]|jgi:CRP-like cAMP-binding protein
MNFSFLSGCPIFRGLSAAELEKALDCLGAQVRSYGRNDRIFHSGDCIQSMALVLSGSVLIEHDDVWGNRSILSRIEPGQIFAETYACIPGQPLLVNAAAAEQTEILLLNASRLLEPCSSPCVCHARLLRNLLSLTAQKNLILSQRIMYTAPKSIRGRVAAYLSAQAAAQGSRRVTIPYNRQQLADHLNVERSALSAELSKMQRDGLIILEKNTFVILD